jgi:ribosomal protein S18 acetylase RimI-like enzyme
MDSFVIYKINGNLLKKPIKGTIRLCTNDDVDQIYDVQNAVIDFFNENEKSYFMPFKKESYSRIVNNPTKDGEIYGAFIGNEMIGWVFLNINDRMKEIKKRVPEIDGSCADVDGVIVLPSYRGNGLQNILVNYMEDKARNKGIKYVVAEVTFGNEYSLINLKKLGYEIKSWYQKDKHIKRHILCKKL